MKGLEELAKHYFYDGDHAVEFEDLHGSGYMISGVARLVVSHDCAQQMESTVIKAERYSMGGKYGHGALSQLPEDRWTGSCHQRTASLLTRRP